MERHPYGPALVDRDHARLVGLLTDDVVFHSPIIGSEAFQGRAAVSELLKIVLDRLTDVEFTHEARVDGGYMYVFDARVLGKPVKTATLLELEPDDRISEIWVMARPLSGIAAIAEAIGTGLLERARPGRGGAIRALSLPLAGMAALTDRIGSRMISDLNRSST